MGSGHSWQELPLGDLVADITVGHVGPMASEYRDSGVPFLRSQNVKAGRIDLEDVKYVSPEFHGKLKNSSLSPGDVVVVRTGAPGTAAVVPQDLHPLNCADLVIIRPSNHLHPRLISYVFNSTFGWSVVRAQLVGAVQQHFNVGSARRMLISVPPPREQEAIVTILGALDDKIELNRRTSETLEQMARALFKSWFIDFDPVRAKAEGRVPFGVDEATAAHFPRTLRHSDSGVIPEGWRVSGIHDVAVVEYGAPYSSRRFTTEDIGLPVIRIRDLASQKPEIRTDEQHPREVRVQPGDIVVGMDGEFRAYVWCGDVAVLNQRLCRFSPKQRLDSAFVRLSIERPLALVEGTEVATTVIHLGKSDIDGFRVLVPTRPVLDAFGETTAPLHFYAISSASQARSLLALRDALLPKLLSGELRIKDAERFVADVT